MKTLSTLLKGALKPSSSAAIRQAFESRTRKNDLSFSDAGLSDEVSKLSRRRYRVTLTPRGRTFVKK